MELYDSEKKLHEVPWYFVKETPGVLGFADGDRPTPMKQDEVDGMLSQIREKEEKITPKIILPSGIGSRWGWSLPEPRGSGGRGRYRERARSRGSFYFRTVHSRGVGILAGGKELSFYG